MLFGDERKAQAFMSWVKYFLLKYYWMDMLNRKTDQFSCQHTFQHCC